jgi:thiol-disulfide isomerase/thioredoxin
LNLLNEFNLAMTYETYIGELGQYLSLHKLHYNKFILNQDLIARISKFKPLKILVLTESWCADSLALLPLMRKITEANANWELRVLRRDLNPELMEKFLNNGLRAIPVFLFLDEQGKFLFRWGPRPHVTAEIFESHRPLIAQGKIEKQEVIKKIRTFYAKDRGQTTLKELLALFKDKNL